MLKKKFKFYLIVSVCVSLLVGVVTTVMYIQYLSGWWDVISDPYWDPSGSNYNPDLWVLVPLGFVIGFFVPLIAYVLDKIFGATVDKLP